MYPGGPQVSFFAPKHMKTDVLLTTVAGPLRSGAARMRPTHPSPTGVRPSDTGKSSRPEQLLLNVCLHERTRHLHTIHAYGPPTF